MTRVNNKVSTALLLVVAVAVAIVRSSDAHIGEYDEHWTRKMAAAKRAVELAYHPQPLNVTYHLNHQVHLAMKEYMSSQINTTRRHLETMEDGGTCIVTNPIDRCWRCRGDWAENRQRLADCVIGFGRGTTGGKGGSYYVVTDSSDNDMVNPKPGTLRHAVIQNEPLWIIFARPMVIRLNQELLVSSHKTIDARGANVHIAHGAGITIQFVQNVIIHGLHIHDIVSGSGGLVRDSIDHYGMRTQSDGDGISIYGSSNIWIDHISLSRCYDGLIDVIQGSTAITISNVHMSHHNEVFLFGGHDEYNNDEKMQITVAFNHFGKGLVQRMPRCRWGFFHVVNNDYTHWNMYAIGGSSNPTIISQGNRFIAPPDNPFAKEVTKRDLVPGSDWTNWIWKSENDLFMNGAFFTESGPPLTTNPYANQMIEAFPGHYASQLTRFTGPRKCHPGEGC